MGMNWKYFNKIWTEKRFDEVLSTVKSLPNVETVNVILEGVAQKIQKQSNERMQKSVAGVGGQSAADTQCAFLDEAQLRRCMDLYYFRDKTLHFTYSKGPKETAEYMVRTARVTADHRFQKLRVNALTISDHNKDLIKESSDGRKDILMSQLMAIHGLSNFKAAGITAKYPSVSKLMKTYQSVSRETGEMLLKDIVIPMKTSKIGKAMSRKVYEVFYAGMDGDKMMNT